MCPHGEMLPPNPGLRDAGSGARPPSPATGSPVCQLAPASWPDRAGGRWGPQAPGRGRWRTLPGPSSRGRCLWLRRDLERSRGGPTPRGREGGTGGRTGHVLLETSLGSLGPRCPPRPVARGAVLAGSGPGPSWLRMGATGRESPAGIAALALQGRTSRTPASGNLDSRGLWKWPGRRTGPAAGLPGPPGRWGWRRVELTFWLL